MRTLTSALRSLWRVWEMAFYSRHLLLFSMFLVVLLTACDPCRNLAEKICECEETAAARDACRRSLDVYGNMQSYSTAAKTQICSDVLARESCNCLALRNGEVENCGMTR